MTVSDGVTGTARVRFLSGIRASFRVFQGHATHTAGATMDRSAKRRLGAVRLTHIHSALAIVIAAVVAACSSSGATGDADAHATGTLALAGVTTGQNLGAGYAVFVDSGPALLLLANGTAGPDTGLSAGP